MESKKQKIIKILKRIGIGLSLGFNVLFLIALIIGSGASKKQVNCCLAESDNVVEKLDIKQDNKRYVSYNDETYTITLSVNELNNYTFVNLGLAILDDDDIDVDSISFIYNEVESSLLGAKTDTKIYIDYNSTTIDYYFSGYFAIGGVRNVFEYDLVIYAGSYYSTLKSAIESDITANESNINDGIFETLTEGVTAFIGSIGAGISSMVGVFYDSANSQLTTIGLLSVIVVAVSLAYFLFRLIIGLIRMRG